MILKSEIRNPKSEIPRRQNVGWLRTSGFGFRVSDFRRQPAVGFTLIELILGIGIMATVLVAINAVFFSTMRLRERTNIAVEESLPIQQSLSILRRDLQGAMAPAGEGMLAGDFKVGNVTSLGMGLPVDIEFCTTTGILRDSEPWSEVQKVAYGLRLSNNRNVAGSDLYRLVTRNLLATITPQPEEQWMMSGVERIEFSCYDGSQWRDYWDTSITDTNLPGAVRVRILLAAQNENSDVRPIEMVVPVASQSLTNLAYTTTTEL
jgi:type II secretion system protein J